MADRWRSTQVIAWTERDGPGRPPKGPNRALGFGLSATLGAVFAGMVISDSLCPEHRMWVQGLATLGLACIVGAAIGLAKGWSYAPVLAVVAGFAGVAIGAVDTVHDPARGQLIVLVMGAAALAASALALRQITLARWERDVQRQLLADPTCLPVDGETIVPTADREQGRRVGAFAHLRSDGWPEPVVRHLHRPLLALAALAFVAGWFFLGDIASASFSDDRSDYLALEGIVAEDWNGRGDIPVAYYNPLTDQQVEATVLVFDPGLLPAGPGATVALEVAPENPDLVFVAGDYQPATRDAAFYLAVLAVPSVVWWLRRRSVRQAAARFESTEPTFMMTGAIAPPRFIGERHCDLHLWPLDAEPGAPSQCRVPLLSTGGSPIGGPAFNVEVKGSPRPLGRLVARVQDGPLLWPVGGASFGGARPRPSEIDRVVPFLPAPVLPPPRPPVWWAVTRIPLAIAAVSAVAWIVVTGTVLVNGATADEIASSGTPVIARVEAREEGRLLVTYQVEERSPTIQGRAPSDVPGDYTVGRRYPAHAGLDDPTRLRFDGEPYDRAQPIASVTLVLLAALTALVIALTRWRRLCALAQDGPWWEVEASAGQRGDLLRILVPGTDQVPCTIDIRGLGGTEWDVPTLATRRVLVAGALEPGSLVAVRDGAKLLDREHLMAGASPSLRGF